MIAETLAFAQRWPWIVATLRDVLIVALFSTGVVVSAIVIVRGES